MGNQPPFCLPYMLEYIELNSSLGVKLWENANPSASFAPQTVTLSSSDYDAIRIFYFSGGGYGLHSMDFVKVSTDGAILTVGTYGQYPQIGIRDFTFENDGTLSFKEGRSSTHLSAITTDNSILVPYKIYGYKFA